METADIVKIIAGALSGAVTGNLVSVIDEGLWIVKHFLQDDPVKLAKAEKQYLLNLLDLSRRVRESETGADVTDILVAYNSLLDK